MAGNNLKENLEFFPVHLVWSLENMTLQGLPYLYAWVWGQIPGCAAGCSHITAGNLLGLADLLAMSLGT